MKNTAWILLTFLLVVAAASVGYFEIMGPDEVVPPATYGAPTPALSATTTPSIIPTLVPVATEVPK
jgi:hypothetical protein